MKFPGTCIVCNEKIPVNEVGLWAKGIGVKHEKCAQVRDLSCMVCGNSAGCSQCEFQDICDLDKVSSFCICMRCRDDDDSFARYRDSSKSKFLLLGAK